MSLGDEHLQFFLFMLFLFILHCFVVLFLFVCFLNYFLQLATEAKLSEEKSLILYGQSPLPIYTSVRVKKAVDARIFCGEFIDCY